MDALVTHEPPQRVHVVGPSGAGETSLVLRVIADLARRQLDIAHEVLILRVGDRPERLSSGEEVMKTVLVTIAVEGHRFSNISPQVLQAAAADQRTQTPRAGRAPRRLGRPVDQLHR
jgi:transcription termination factor Rho